MHFFDVCGRITIVWGKKVKSDSVIRIVLLIKTFIGLTPKNAKIRMG